jgi:hypothetical protein
MNSQPASRAAVHASRYTLHALPFTANVAFRFRDDSVSRKRQNPTRIPYSCHAQLGTSGRSGWPIGGGSTARGMAPAGFQFSTLTIVQTATRASLGSRSGGRRVMGS